MPNPQLNMKDQMKKSDQKKTAATKAAQQKTDPDVFRLPTAFDKPTGERKVLDDTLKDAVKAVKKPKKKK